MRGFLADMARVADTLISAYPNAGLPNAFGGYDETPETTARHLGAWARDGLVNLVGGCCGTTPAHIAAVAEAVAGVTPRKPPRMERRMRLAGARTLRRGGMSERDARASARFVNIGERTNVTGSAVFRRLIEAGDYEAALDVARRQVENGAQIIDVNMDEGNARQRARHDRLPQHDRRRAGHRPRADHDRFVEMVGDRGRAEMRPGQGHCELDQPEGGRGAVPRPGAAHPPLRGGDGGHGLRRGGPGGRRPARKFAICERSYRLLVDEAGFPPEDIVFDPQHLRRGDRDRGA